MQKGNWTSFHQDISKVYCKIQTNDRFESDLCLTFAVQGTEA